jgi:hypothetical protein
MENYVSVSEYIITHPTNSDKMWYVVYTIIFRVNLILAHKVKLSLCLINEALRHEDIWGSGGIAPPFLT